MCTYCFSYYFLTQAFYVLDYIGHIEHMMLDCREIVFGKRIPLCQHWLLAPYAVLTTNT